MKKWNVLLIIFSVLFVIDIVLLVISLAAPEILLQPTVNTSSQVLVEEYFAYQLSPALATGITFETVTQAPLVDNPAMENDGGLSGSTLYYVEVSSDSSVPVDICTSADRPLTNDANSVVFGPLNEETYLTASTTDANTPGPSSASIGLTTTNALFASDIPNGGFAYARYWVDVRGDIQTGTYDNTVFYIGQVAGSGEHC